MIINISSLSEAAFRGDWNPLIREAEKARGKNWAQTANCTDYDTEIFFPAGDGPREEPLKVGARLGLSLVQPLSLCASCPLTIAARCLVESLRDDDEFGIRAGLLASERSPLRSAWQNRVDEGVVQAALHGSTAALSGLERDEVIARFAADPSLDPAAVARGLGVTHEYLLKLVRRHRQKTLPASASSSPVQSADAV